MSASFPISDLENYETVLEKVGTGSPVYLTNNGRSAYCIRNIKDEEDFQKAEAMIHLFCVLNAGICSVGSNGWISEDEFRNHFQGRRNKTQ